MGSRDRLTGRGSAKTFLAATCLFFWSMFLAVTAHAQNTLSGTISLPSGQSSLSEDGESLQVTISVDSYAADGTVLRQGGVLFLFPEDSPSSSPYELSYETLEDSELAVSFFCSGVSSEANENFNTFLNSDLCNSIDGGTNLKYYLQDDGSFSTSFNTVVRESLGSTLNFSFPSRPTARIRTLSGTISLPPGVIPSQTTQVAINIDEFDSDGNFVRKISPGLGTGPNDFRGITLDFDGRNSFSYTFDYFSPDQDNQLLVHIQCISLSSCAEVDGGSFAEFQLQDNGRFNEEFDTIAAFNLPNPLNFQFPTPRTLNGTISLPSGVVADDFTIVFVEVTEFDGDGNIVGDNSSFAEFTLPEVDSPIVQIPSGANSVDYSVGYFTPSPGNELRITFGCASRETCQLIDNGLFSVSASQDDGNPIVTPFRLQDDGDFRDQFNTVRFIEIPNPLDFQFPSPKTLSGIISLPFGVTADEFTEVTVRVIERDSNGNFVRDNSVFDQFLIALEPPVFRFEEGASQTDYAVTYAEPKPGNELQITFQCGRLRVDCEEVDGGLLRIFELQDDGTFFDLFNTIAPEDLEAPLNFQFPPVPIIDTLFGEISLPTGVVSDGTASIRVSVSERITLGGFARNITSGVFVVPAGRNSTDFVLRYIRPEGVNVVQITIACQTGCEPIDGGQEVSFTFQDDGSFDESPNTVPPESVPESISFRFPIPTAPPPPTNNGMIFLPQGALDRDIQFFVMISEIDDQHNVILDFPRVSGLLPAGQTSAPFEIEDSLINPNGRYVVTYGCELATDCANLVGVQFLTGEGEVVFTLEELRETSVVSGGSLLSELENLVLQEGRAVDVQLAAPSGTPLESNVFAFARFESVLDSGQRRSLFGVRLSLAAGELVSDSLPFVLPPIPEGASYSVAFFCDGDDDVTPCDGLVRRGLFSPDGTQLSEDDVDTLVSPSDFPDTVVLELVPGNNANFSITGPDSVTGPLLFDIEVDLLNANGTIIETQRISTIDVSRFENLASSLPLNFSAVLPAFPEGEIDGFYRIRYACSENPVIVRLDVPIGDISCEGLVADSPSYLATFPQGAIPDPIVLPLFEDIVGNPNTGFSIRLGDDQAFPLADVEVYRISADGSTVVYITQSGGLFSVPIAGGIPIRLAEMSGGSFKISPDGSRVVYRDAIDGLAGVGLFSVSILGGDPVRLTGDFVEQPFNSFRDSDFDFSPDSSRVVYRAAEGRSSSGSRFVFELFSVPVIGGAPIRLNGDLPAEGFVHDNFQISSDGSRVVYLAQQNSRDIDELFSVPITGGQPVRLNAELPLGGDVRQFGFEISPDGSRVVYLADQNERDVDELFSVPIAGGAQVKLNEDGFAFRNGNRFQINSNGDRVVYLTGRISGEQLFSVSITGGPSIRLDQGEDSPRGEIRESFQITPDGSRVVYTFSGDFGEVRQLFSVDIDGGVPILLNKELNPNETIDDFSADLIRISPDGTRVVYLTQLPTGFVNATGASEILNRLFSVPVLGGNPVILNDNTVSVGERNGLRGFRFSPDSSRVVYVSDQLTEGVNELFSVPITGGTPIRLNDDLVNGGNVSFFPVGPEIGSNGDFVVYLADKNVDEQFELFSSPLLGANAFDGVVSLPQGPVDRDTQFFVSITEVAGDGSFQALPFIAGTIPAGQTSAGFDLGDITINESATYAVTFGCLTNSGCGDLLGFHFLTATGTVFAFADAQGSLVPGADLARRLRDLSLQTGTAIDVQVGLESDTPLESDVTVFSRFESVLSSGERQSLFGFRFNLAAGDLRSDTVSFALPPLPAGASYSIRFFCDDADANLPCDDIVRGGLFSPNGTQFSDDDVTTLIDPNQVPDSVLLSLISGDGVNFSLTGPESISGPLLFDIDVDLLDSDGNIIEAQQFASIDVSRFAELADGFPLDFSTVIPAFPEDMTGGSYRIRYACSEDPVITRLSVPIDDISCAGFVAQSPSYEVSFPQDSIPNPIVLPFFEAAISGVVELDRGLRDRDTQFFIALTEISNDGQVVNLPTISGIIEAGQLSAEFQFDAASVNEGANYLVTFGCAAGSDCGNLIGFNFLRADGTTVFSFSDVQNSFVPGTQLSTLLANLSLQSGTEIDVQVALQDNIPLDVDITVFVRFESVLASTARISLFGNRFNLPAGQLASDTLPFVLPPIADGASYSIRYFCDDAEATLPCEGIVRSGFYSPNGTQLSQNDPDTLINPNQVPDSVVLDLLAGTQANFSIRGPESAVGPLLFDIEIDLLDASNQLVESQRFSSINVERFAELADGFPLDFSTALPNFPDGTTGGTYRIRYACSEEAVITRLSVPISDVSCEGFISDDGSYVVSFPQDSIPDPIVLQFIEFVPIAPDAFEIDDTIEQADELEVGQNRMHSLHQVGDEDWTRFTLNQTSSISLATLVNDNEADTSLLEMTLFDESANPIATDLDQLSSDEFENPLLRVIDLENLEPGNYLLRVRANSPSNLIASYNLRFTGPELSLDDALCFPITVPERTTTVICL